MNVEKDVIESIIRSATILSKDIDELTEKYPITIDNSIGWAIFMMQVGSKMDYIAKTLCVLTENMKIADTKKNPDAR